MKCQYSDNCKKAGSMIQRGAGLVEYVCPEDDRCEDYAPMIYKQTAEEYFKEPYVSNSFLIAFDRSPLHAMTPKEATKEMQTGTLIHSYILDQIAPVVCDLDKRTKEYKTFAAENEGKVFITSEQQQMLDAVNDAVNELKIDGRSFCEYYDDGIKEASIFWDDKKGKADLISGQYIFDLKKTQDASAFHWSIKNYKYYRQAAWYLEGLKAATGKDGRFIFIAIETEPPYGVKMYELDAEYLALGDRENIMSYMAYKDWLDKGRPKIAYKNDLVEIISKPSYL